MSTLRFGQLDQATKRRALLIGAAVATAFCIVVPRIGPLVVVALTCVAAAILMVRNVQESAWKEALRATFVRPEMLFPVWAIIACLWSMSPPSAFLKALFLAALIVHVIIIAQNAHVLDRDDIASISKGLLLGFIVGGLYVVLEIPTRDILGRLVLTYFPELDRGLGKHSFLQDGVVTRVSGSHLTRVAVVFSLFWCPALLAVSLYTKGTARWLSVAAILAASLVIVLHPRSHSQTAQLALLVGLLFTTFAIAWPSVAKWIAGASFAGAVLLIVPASMLMFAAKVHEKPDLFKSARARVVIWNFTSERILENPILGVGTYSTRYLDEMRAKQAKAANDAERLVVEAATRAHPHNIYLHVWYELGIIGVLAFAVFGLSLLRKIDRLPKQGVVLGIGHFAICMTVIASTYGLWQNWFQSAIALSILSLIVIADPGALRRLASAGTSRS